MADLDHRLNISKPVAVIGAGWAKFFYAPAQRRTD
jgi:hypothetical protein